MSPLNVKNEAEAKRYLQMTIDGDAIDVTPTPKKRRIVSETAPPTEKKPKRDQPELKEQIRYFDKIHLLKGKYPFLKRIYAHLTGIFIVPHKIDEVAESGMIRGLLDIEVRVPIRHAQQHYAGLVIDLKTPTGVPTPDQLEWAHYLIGCGYRAYFCKGVKNVFSPWQEAWICTSVFLGITGHDSLPYFSEEEEYALYQWRTAKLQARAERAVQTRAKKREGE